MAQFMGGRSTELEFKIHNRPKFDSIQNSKFNTQNWSRFSPCDLFFTKKMLENQYEIGLIHRLILLQQKLRKKD